MSTTLGVIPTVIESDLTYGNVMRLAEKTMSEYLESIQMKIAIHIDVQVHDMNESYIKEVSESDKFTWKPSEFALFTINNIKGGPEAYCESISTTLEYWANYLEDICGKLVTPEQLKQIKTNNIKWYFTRASGRSALVNLAYGHLAAATAELTHGIIHSKTGWDPAAFPATAPGFLETYFKPEKTMHAVSKKWAEKSLHDLRVSSVGKKGMTDYEMAK